MYSEDKRQKMTFVLFLLNDKYYSYRIFIQYSRPIMNIIQNKKNLFLPIDIQTKA